MSEHQCSWTRSGLDPSHSFTGRYPSRHNVLRTCVGPAAGDALPTSNPVGGVSDLDPSHTTSYGRPGSGSHWLSLGWLLMLDIWFRAWWIYSAALYFVTRNTWSSCFGFIGIFNVTRNTGSSLLPPLPADPFHYTTLVASVSYSRWTGDDVFARYIQWLYVMGGISH